ncbi:MAG TPA: hypothetical protein RMH80_31855, partial [Polyangiaceae bacterium LLY-WYZ-15_(1-7)]|nr:hypothetical protein [Polyangiaceae bacterium LLY-WYZ-15_(1-7)]
IRAVRHALPRPEEAGVYDIGGPDVMSYREMMARTARVLGKRRPTLPVPLFTPELSTLWVTLVTGAPRALVGPLVQSLRHAMVARPNPLLASLLEDAQGFEEALRAALDEEARASATPRVADRAAERREHRPARTVRSVQRLPRPAGLDADDVARAYLDWLPRHLWPVLRAERDGDVVSLGFWGLPRPLLELTLSAERSTPDRALFYVTGGLLARTDGPRPGRLEFRRVMGDAVLAAIHDFQPALPWPVYKATQALAHLEVMHAFGRHLRALERAPTSAAGKLVEARP